MQLPYIKERHLDRLIRNRNTLVEQGFFTREEPWLDEYFAGELWNKDSRVAVGEAPALVMPNGGETPDLENYEWLKQLSPSQASDPRVWAYMSFVLYWSYNQSRWPGASSNIDDRYFLLRKNTRCLIRNGLSRLWWFAYLTYDETRVDRYELTQVLLSHQDIQASLLERSFGKNINVLHGTLEFIKKHPEKVSAIGQDYKKSIQGLAKRVNQHGGVTMLDTFSKNEVFGYLAEAF